MNEGPHHKVPWLSVLLALAAIVALFEMSGSPLQNVVPPSVRIYNAGMNEAILPTSVSISGTTQAKGAPGAMEDASYSSGVITAQATMMPAMYPYPGAGTSNANDTREFNKMYYSANMRTRDVPGLTHTIETLIRGSSGRVDQTNSSHDAGYISFVVPQDKFEDFRTEIEKLVDWRFLTVSINSQNLLPQKQAIEKQQDYTNMTLDQLNAARKKEITDYNSKKTNIQYQIDANERELAMISTEMKTADQSSMGNLANRQMQLYSDQTNLKNQINSLEKTHLNTINSIDAQISYQNGNKDALTKQNQDLLDNVATVDGTISINWMSLWEMAQGYAPGYTIPGTLFVLALVALWFQRRREKLAV